MHISWFLNETFAFFITFVHKLALTTDFPKGYRQKQTQRQQPITKAEKNINFKLKSIMYFGLFVGDIASS